MVNLIFSGYDQAHNTSEKQRKFCHKDYNFWNCLHNAAKSRFKGPLSTGHRFTVQLGNEYGRIRSLKTEFRSTKDKMALNSMSRKSRLECTVIAICQRPVTSMVCSKLIFNLKKI